MMKEQDRLMLQVAGQPKVELFPASETKFFSKVNDAPIAFHRDEGGKVTGFTLGGHDQNMLAKRLEPPTLKGSQLAEYVGDYYSAELGTTYTIGLESGQLVAKRRRHEDIALTPLDADWFAGIEHVHFTRDHDRRVTGLRLAGGGNRNMRFDKQAH
jgi:hypothetical protein